ncbi:MAG: hydroxyacylglutathione hydrolase [Wenzhouxiangellaceae bacterium]|nr:hydroxyacylglutathione hydrolase [Wenzhouxiangellaceae bacterium]
MTINFQAIPAFSDNYIWAIRTAGDGCVLVDPGQAEPALAYLDRHALRLEGLLLTHHHADHICGVAGLREQHPAPAWGPDDPRMPADMQRVTEGERVEIGGLAFDVLETPGHTRSHIVFYTPGAVLCGDTLFSAGCGRLFEGTPGQMQASFDKLAALPDETRVYCAHEYTAANCRFAQAVEPDNPALAERAREVEALRADGHITLPTTIAEEKTFNPFLRTREPAVIDAAAAREPAAGSGADAVFGVIRRWKDSF